MCGRFSSIINPDVRLSASARLSLEAHMADPNALLTPSLITKTTLAILENNLVAAGKVNRALEAQFNKIGATITVRMPNKFTVSDGPGLSIQNIVEPSTAITISNQKHIDFQFSMSELLLTIEEFSDRYLKPAAVKLANQVDYDVLGNFDAIYNEVGTPGVIPNAFSYICAVGERMDTFAVPQDGRTLVLGTKANWALANALSSGVYVRSVAEPAFKGYLASLANLEIYEDQNIQAQKVGAYGALGTQVVSVGGQTGSSIATSGWPQNVVGLLNIGDVFSIAGVYSLNPGNLEANEDLAQFVVTAPVNSDNSGNATITIDPPITTVGAYATVDSSPILNAPITVMGSSGVKYKQNLAFSRDAFGLVMVPMELPQGVDFAARQQWKGMSLRIIRQYDINSDVMPCRMDILYGTTTFYPELACRLTN